MFQYLRMHRRFWKVTAPEEKIPSMQDLPIQSAIVTPKAGSTIELDDIEADRCGYMKNECEYSTFWGSSLGLLRVLVHAGSFVIFVAFQLQCRPWQVKGFAWSGGGRGAKRESMGVGSLAQFAKTVGSIGVWFLWLNPSMPGIVRVDVSIDEGSTWVTADLLDGKDLSPGRMESLWGSQRGKYPFWNFQDWAVLVIMW